VRPRCFVIFPFAIRDNRDKRRESPRELRERMINTEPLSTAESQRAHHKGRNDGSRCRASLAGRCVQAVLADRKRPDHVADA